MDSGNSGSLQSSSGGDEEFDSRCSGSISALFNSSNNQPQSHLHNHQPSMFDHLSSYLDVFSRSTQPLNSNSLVNHDMVWPRGILRSSEPNCGTQIGELNMGSSSTPPIFSTQQGPVRPQLQNLSSIVPEKGVRPSSSSGTTLGVTRNPKKRSRASRRAPTTILTTDTSNFRAMVQEYTGIPAPPFSASMPYPRSRLDLFNSSSSGPPPYLLRPFVHRAQPPSFLSPTMVDAITSTTTTTTTMGNVSNPMLTNNYGLPSQLGLPKQSQNLLNMQNPTLTFQSLLQSTPPKYPLNNVPLPVFGATNPSNDSHLKLGTFEELGNMSTDLGGLQNIVTSDSRRISNWGEGTDNGLGQGQLRSFDDSYGNLQRGTNCKMNFSTPTTDFQADKGPENVTSRGEGIVDSWICSSD
ncbi:hypothetical protein GIB67_038893 [Kingdonia uniflora]|uniref:VQ domain-containing protein n=1 Tax=Kingdonia uniflora TaxID=39325 RepID=A0A7J7M2Q6_9MAGN|nr:hypothetical protein GIB67_038893 [Kingdonia uniflora]